MEVLFGDSLDKGRRYIDGPEDAPEGVEPEQGPQGGWYYEVDNESASDGNEETEEEEADSPDIEFTEASPEEYANSVSEFIENNPNKGIYLTEHDAEEFEEKDYDLITTQDNTAGASVSPSGDIQNVFAKEEAEDGAGVEALQQAIEQGGGTLDAYAAGLEELYMENGFVEVARQEFNPEFAPEGWEEDPHMKKHVRIARKYMEEHGEPPDVVFMAYDPDEAERLLDLPEEERHTDKYIDDWDEAKSMSESRAINIEGENSET